MLYHDFCVQVATCNITCLLYEMRDRRAYAAVEYVEESRAEEYDDDERHHDADHDGTPDRPHVVGCRSDEYEAHAAMPYRRRHDV